MRKTRPPRSSSQPTAVGNSRKRQRQVSPRDLRFAQGVLAGKTKVQAARDAGYSELTALKKSWKFVQRPQLQSFLTEALENLGVSGEKIVQPVADALEATEVVRTEAGKILTDYPDHRTRLQAHDRAVELYGLGGRFREQEKPAPPSLICNFFRVEEGKTSVRKDVTPPSASEPLKVTFTREGDE